MAKKSSKSSAKAVKKAKRSAAVKRARKSNLMGSAPKKPRAANKRSKRSNIKSRRPGWLAPLAGALAAAAVLILLNLHIVIGNLIVWVTPSTVSAAQSTLPVDEEVIVSKEPRIIIPKINVDAPLVLGMPGVDEPSVQKALENGVLHFADTALPGTTGNMVLVGHSSNSVWEPGDYKFVFALLDRLDPGDKIFIFYEGQRYTFTVNGEKVVNPEDVSVLNQTQTPTLTLITCTPVGTAINRLVITAEQTNPDPASAKVNPVQLYNQGVQLPGN